MESVISRVPQQDTKRVRRGLNVRDLVLYGIVGALGLDTLGVSASYGGQALFWILLVGLTFSCPIGCSWQS